jgi:hypothetical protein
MSGTVSVVVPTPVPSSGGASTEKTVAFSTTVASTPAAGHSKTDFSETVPATMAEFEKTVVQGVIRPGESNSGNGLNLKK